MKKLILISALLFSFNGWAEDVNGSMRCVIKDQIIIEIEDGVTTRYSSIEIKPKKGDSIPFTYEYDEQSSELSLMLGKVGEGFFLYTYDTTTTQSNEASIETLEKMTGMNVPKRYFVYSGSSPNISSFSMNDDSISADRLNLWNLSLKRYFKNDWNGIFTETVSDATHIVAFDCRQTSNRLDELLEALDNLSEENE